MAKALIEIRPNFGGKYLSIVISKQIEAQIHVKINYVPYHIIRKLKKTLGDSPDFFKFNGKITAKTSLNSGKNNGKN